jgi:RHS repeat-associated protein
MGMTTLEDIQYLVNAVGNRTQMTDSAGVTTWSYDNLDRLTNVSYPNGDTVVYGYDKVGNRTSHTVNGVAKTNTFDNANRMTASGTDTYSYDANGNQTGKTSGGVTTTYSYDPLDRLTGISGPVAASYAYNGDGLRVSRTVSGVTTRYTWDVLGLPKVLADGNEYVWGAGLVAQVTGAGTATYVHVDGLGSVRVVTDAMGTVAGTKQYDAFGAARGTTGVTLPFGYTGEQEDAESGLVYLRARYMDPASGRFLTNDPFLGRLAAPRSLHAYSYVWNSPVRYTDPRGTDPCDNSNGRQGCQPGGTTPSRACQYVACPSPATPPSQNRPPTPPRTPPSRVCR